MGEQSSISGEAFERSSGSFSHGKKVISMSVEKPLSNESAPERILENQTVPVRRIGWRMRRMVIMSAVSLLCLGLLALLGSQLLLPAQNQAAASPLLGHPAQDFTLTILNANTSSTTIHLADLRGKPVMLNFWASWCDVCKLEAPLLENTWLRAQSQGIVFVGIDFEDTHSDGLNFLRTYDITYPNIVDSTGATAIAYGVTGVPESVFVNRQGIIVTKVIGELTDQMLQTNLRLIAWLAFSVPRRE